MHTAAQRLPGASLADVARAELPALPTPEALAARLAGGGVAGEGGSVLGGGAGGGAGGMPASS